MKYWPGSVKNTRWIFARSLRNNFPVNAYLWHWPIFVALVYTEFQDQPLAILVGMLLTLVVAHLSHQWIENPARRLLGRIHDYRAVGVLVLVVLVVIASAFVIRGHRGLWADFHLH